MRALAVLLAATFLGGCCRQQRPTTVADSTDDLLAALRAPAVEQPTIRGEIQADHMGPEGRIAGRVYAFASSGGRLRLEAVSPLDTPLQTVAVGDGTFSLVDRENQRCLQGEARPCLVGSAIGLELSAEHVASALVGAVPLIRHVRVDSSWNRCGFWDLELVGEDEGWTQRVELELHDGHAVARSSTITGPDGVVLEVTLGGYERQGDRELPRRLRLRMPRSEADLRVEWRQIEIGVSLPDSAWTAACPEGFAPEQATCAPRSELPELEPPGGREAPPVEPPETAPDEPGGEETPDEGEPDLSEELGL